MVTDREQLRHQNLNEGSRQLDVCSKDFATFPVV